ncbi:MAG TPA: hypothetical protein VGB17_02315 [Pyrinomonadaceae bacterium]
MAKSGTITIFLVDQAEHNQYYWGEGTMYVVGTYLREYFTRICQHPSSTIANADFSWYSSWGRLKPQDIIIHFFDRPAKGLIEGTFNQSAPHPGGSGGTWKSPGGMISEIYLEPMQGDRDYARLVANIAFHEAMHNKLDADPQHQSVADIHGLGGLASRVVQRGSQLSQSNIIKMAPALSKAVPQF